MDESACIQRLATDTFSALRDMCERRCTRKGPLATVGGPVVNLQKKLEK